MGGSRRRKVAVIDAETDPFRYGRIPCPFIWGYYDGEQYLEFDDADDLVEWLAPQKLVVYAHNGGRFDYHFILDWIEYGTEITVIANRIAKFKIGECEFRDSWNLLPVPLAQLQKDEIDYKIMERGERDKPANKKTISNYLQSDCTYLWNWVNAFIETYGQKITVASTAMAYWAKMEGVTPPRDHKGELYHELKHYYHGGRTQCFYHGEFEKPFQLADINSAYPFAMMHPHPIGLDRYTGEGKKEWQSLEIARRRTSLMTVRGVASGCFPWRDKKNALFYPDDSITGEIRTFNVTGWEYIAALETKTFKGKVLEFHYFDVLTDFSGYVMHFYNMKKNTTKGSPDYQFAKLLMNSLYGKFASNPEEYREYQAGWPDMIDGDGNAGDDWEWNVDINEDLCIISRPLPEEKHKFFNLATAASITGFVRAYMWRAICLCQNEKGDGVLYCDTDSIAATDISKLSYGSELGEWDNEGSFDYGAFGGRKLYAMHYEGKPRSYSFEKRNTKNWKMASKGVKLTPNQMIKVARGETVLYKPMAPTFSLNKGAYFISRRVKMVNKSVDIPTENTG